jgi:hypothetical protein
MAIQRLVRVSGHFINARLMVLFSYKQQIGIHSVQGTIHSNF